MKRENYTEQMDNVHVPKDRAQKTLQMMLEENRRLAKKEAAGHADKKQGALSMPFNLRYGYVLAAAASLAILFFSVNLLNSGISFHSVRMSSLPSLGGTRGSEAEALSFEQAFGRSEDALFPGWEITQAQAEALETGAGPLYVGRAVLTKDGNSLQATVTDFEPPLLALLKSEEIEMTKGLYLAKDDTLDPATLLAVCEKDGLFIVYSGQGMEENAFLNAVEALK